MLHRRSVLTALGAGLGGLTLWFIDDILVGSLLPRDHGLHEVTEVIELLIMGPGMLVLGWLVAERLRLARAATQQAEELRFSALGRIAGSIAHEVRNPLHAITLAVTELHQQGRLSPDDHALLDRQLDRIRTVITQVYALATPVGPTGQSADLARLRHELQHVHPSVDTTALHGQVPIPADTLLVVLDNLLRNAKAHDPHPVLRSEPGRLRVTNRGQLPPLSETPPSTSGGLGLGLFIVRQLLQRHGAGLTLEQHGEVVVATITWKTP